MSNAEVLVQLVNSFLNAEDNSYLLLSIDMDERLVANLGEFHDFDSAMKHMIADFFWFATTCEEECGEPPNLMSDVAIIVGNRVEAVARWRAPTSAAESKYPVMVITRNGSVSVVTAESCQIE